MKNQVQSNSEVLEAQKWIEENRDELKKSDITENSLIDDINSFIKEVPQTKEYISRPKGSTLKDLEDYLATVQRDFDRIDMQPTKTIAMAIGKVLEKTKDYPYSIRDVAIKRYMQILGLNYWFLLDFSKGDAQEYDAIFAADTEDLEYDLEKNRARFTIPSTIAKCNLDKTRNCSYSKKELPEDFDKQTREYYQLCERILESMHIEVPTIELLLPFVTYNALKENIEVVKAAQQQDTFELQQLGIGEEIEPEYDTASGFRGVQKSDSKRFWELAKGRSFAEYNIGRIIPIRNIDLREKKYNLLKDLTEELYNKIINSKDYGKEDFKKLYLI